MSKNGGKPREKSRDEAAICDQCQGSGLAADRKRFCSACLGSGKKTKRKSGWQ